MNKYYAVRKGRIPGIFLRWEDCQESVSGFASPEFKSFTNPYEAIDYIVDSSSNTSAKPAESDYNPGQISMKEYAMNNINTDPNVVKVYIDSVTDNTNNRFGCSAIIVKNNEIIDGMFKNGDIDDLMLEKFIGEMSGILLAIKYCKEKQYNKVIIYHYTDEASYFADKEVDANNLKIKQYHEYIKNRRKAMDIIFVKVDMDGFNEFNEEAKQLSVYSLNNK